MRKNTKKAICEIVFEVVSEIVGAAAEAALGLLLG